MVGELRDHGQRVLPVLARPSGVSSLGDVDADGFLITVGAVFDVYRDRIRGEWRCTHSGLSS